MDVIYPVFKGLQKPLEFLGIRGRFLIYAAAACGVSFIMFLILYVVFGGVAGCIGFVICAGFSAIFIFTKQKQGLHSKRRDKGVYVYHYIFKRD